MAQRSIEQSGDWYDWITEEDRRQKDSFSADGMGRVGELSALIHELSATKNHELWIKIYECMIYWPPEAQSFFGPAIGHLRARLMDGADLCESLPDSEFLQRRYPGSGLTPIFSLIESVTDQNLKTQALGAEVLGEQELPPVTNRVKTHKLSAGELEAAHVDQHAAHVRAQQGRGGPVAVVGRTQGAVRTHVESLHASTDVIPEGDDGYKFVRNIILLAVSLVGVGILCAGWVTIDKLVSMAKRNQISLDDPYAGYDKIKLSASNAAKLEAMLDEDGEFESNVRVKIDEDTMELVICQGGELVKIPLDHSDGDVEVEDWAEKASIVCDYDQGSRELACSNSLADLEHYAENATGCSAEDMEGAMVDRSDHGVEDKVPSPEELKEQKCLEEGIVELPDMRIGFKTGGEVMGFVHTFGESSHDVVCKPTGQEDSFERKDERVAISQQVCRDVDDATKSAKLWVPKLEDNVASDEDLGDSPATCRLSGSRIGYMELENCQVVVDECADLDAVKAEVRERVEPDPDDVCEPLVVEHELSASTVRKLRGGLGRTYADADKRVTYCQVNTYSGYDTPRTALSCDSAPVDTSVGDPADILRIGLRSGRFAWAPMPEGVPGPTDIDDAFHRGYFLDGNGEVLTVYYRRDCD